jgi:hypothetical protein
MLVGRTKQTEAFANVLICNVENGNVSLVNLRNVADAERQNIVARLVKAKHGVKAIDGGVLNDMLLVYLQEMMRLLLLRNLLLNPKPLQLLLNHLAL